MSLQSGGTRPRNLARVGHRQTTLLGTRGKQEGREDAPDLELKYLPKNTKSLAAQLAQLDKIIKMTKHELKTMDTASVTLQSSFDESVSAASEPIDGLTPEIDQEREYLGEDSPYVEEDFAAGDAASHDEETMMQEEEST